MSSWSSDLADIIFLSTPSARRATRCGTAFAPGIGRFLSTPSARRATSALRSGYLPRSISIHALREEGDRRLPTHRP